ncbi:hypothetical protein PanWU01x14_225530 [Parasponia andersonii]|uniref:Uncharacterized protein n=1 Tax=Parasponia andersonii TaxID=3476 RepID=A0A2P5BMT9_PARAD|nr:hypothetical protein PanWU01x14_225530 [Parasponia andersonii]
MEEILIFSRAVKRRPSPNGKKLPAIHREVARNILSKSRNNHPYSSLKTPPIPNEFTPLCTIVSELNFMYLEGGGFQQGGETKVSRLRREDNLLRFGESRYSLIKEFAKFDQKVRGTDYASMG